MAFTRQTGGERRQGEDETARQGPWQASMSWRPPAVWGLAVRARYERGDEGGRYYGAVYNYIGRTRTSPARHDAPGAWHDFTHRTWWSGALLAMSGGGEPDIHTTRLRCDRHYAGGCVWRARASCPSCGSEVHRCRGCGEAGQRPRTPLQLTMLAVSQRLPCHKPAVYSEAQQRNKQETKMIADCRENIPHVAMICTVAPTWARLSIATSLTGTEAGLGEAAHTSENTYFVPTTSYQELYALTCYCQTHQLSKRCCSVTTPAPSTRDAPCDASKRQSTGLRASESSPFSSLPTVPPQPEVRGCHRQSSTYRNSLLPLGPAARSLPRRVAPASFDCTPSQSSRLDAAIAIALATTEGSDEHQHSLAHAVLQNVSLHV
ncbi:hypothetical protein BKA63DRAFT_492023 [Paraphoma chrysanthemicola]|nr:hypothetical protein BKA63DRAFT_492023 [Paraphoma chrysanthemicola]